MPPAACRVLCLAYRDIHLPAEALQPSFAASSAASISGDGSSLQPAGERAPGGGSPSAALGSGSESVEASLHAWDDSLSLADNLESHLTLVSAGPPWEAKAF